MLVQMQRIRICAQAWVACQRKCIPVFEPACDGAWPCQAALLAGSCGDINLGPCFLQGNRTRLPYTYSMAETMGCACDHQKSSHTPRGPGAHALSNLHELLQGIQSQAEQNNVD